MSVNFPEAKYTMTFAEVISLKPDFWDSITAINKVKDYPTGDAGQHAKDLAQAFYDKFAFDEIEYGTIDRFAHELNVRINEELSKYNNLWGIVYSSSFSYDPLNEYASEADGTSSSTADANNTTHGYINDRPVTKNSINVENPTDATTDPSSLVTGSASSLTANTGLSKSKADGTTTNKNKGRSGSVAKLIKDFSSQYFDIDTDFLSSLSSMFIQAL